MPPFVKVLFRQLKTRLFLLLSLLRRLLCCFRSKASSAEQSNEYVDEMTMIDGQFIVIGQCDTKQGAYSEQQTAAAAVHEAEVAIDGWDAMAPISRSNNGPQNQQKGAPFSYSNYSLVNQQTQPQFSSNNIGSHISIGPNRTQHVNSSAAHQQQSTDGSQPEPDFFTDMTPKLKKPKTVFVAKEVEARPEEISRKFQIDDRRAVELDETKFKPFGALDDSASAYAAASSAHFSAHPSGQGGQYQQAEQESSWENMASEEASWGGDLDANLLALRREAREQRLREHQEAVRLKQTRKQA